MTLLSLEGGLCPRHLHESLAFPSPLLSPGAGGQDPFIHGFSPCLLNIYYAPRPFWVLGYSGGEDRPRAQIEWMRHTFPERRVDLQVV